jgi:hypothetical protein
MLIERAPTFVPFLSRVESRLLDMPMRYFQVLVNIHKNPCLSAINYFKDILYFKLNS